MCYITVKELSQFKKQDTLTKWRNTVETLVKLINALKDFKDNRFYFITVLLFVGFMIYTFKDKIQETTFKPQTLQEISNESGLKTSLESIKVQHPLIVGYAFYIYQPKVEAYYKSLVLSDITYVHENNFFKSIPLNTQKFLNYRLVGNEYVLFEYTNKEEAEYTHTYASDYVLIYSVYVKETIGEVIFTFNVKPTPAEIEVIVKSLRTIKYFVI